MLGRGLSTRRATDLSVVAILYAVVLVGASAFLLGAIQGDAGFPSIQSRATALLLGITPAALAVVLAVAGIRFAGEYRRRAWGYRIRARVLSYFLAVTAMAGIPSSAFLGFIAIRAVESPCSKTVSSALGAGLELALTYYADKESALAYAADNDIAPLMARGTDAERALARLAEREPALCALELIADGRVVASAGDATAWIAPGVVSLDRSGFLPRISTAGASYARYFCKDAGASPDGRRLSAVLSLRFGPVIEDSAESISSAITLLEKSGRIAGSFPAYLAFFTLCLVAPFIAVAALFSVGAADRLLRPVAALADALARVGAGARRAPYLAKPGDEAGDLVEALNAVLEGLERERGDELRNEKIGAWRDIARKLAHELRNPLTPIRLSAERVLRRWKSDPQSANDVIERSMVAIIQETVNMEALLTEFRDFARLPEPQKDWMELRSTVDEVVHLYSASWPRLTVDCTMIDPAIRLKADRGYLKQALGNLIANAADATDGGGSIWIRADLVKTAESRYCRIQVRDNGPGVPEDVHDRIFSPYFTTKPGGTGLGLAIVEHIVAAHGGSIRFESREGAGTVFFIDLPAENTE